jgi:DinB family protein
MTEWCPGVPADPHAARAQWLSWLAGGARDVVWALCSLPEDRWTAPPPHPDRLGGWAAARHVRHLMLGESRLVLPVVETLLGGPTDAIASRAELDQLNATWDTGMPLEAVRSLVDGLADVRYTLLRCLEGAPDAVWQQPLPDGIAPSGSPAQLDWVLARAHQHELEHLSALWTLSLYWDRSLPPTASGVSLPLQPADRLEESH